MRVIGFLLACYLNAFNVKAQETIVERQETYTHVFLARVIEIDTVIVVRDVYADNNNIPPENFRALDIKIKVLSKISGKFRGISERILVDLQANDHSCLFNFDEGQVYRIHAYSNKYSSYSIKKKYRKYLFRLDCFNMPVIQ